MKRKSHFSPKGSQFCNFWFALALYGKCCVFIPMVKHRNSKLRQWWERAARQGCTPLGFLDQGLLLFLINQTVRVPLIVLQIEITGKQTFFTCPMLIFTAPQPRDQAVLNWLWKLNDILPRCYLGFFLDCPSPFPHTCGTQQTFWLLLDEKEMGEVKGERDALSPLAK